MKTIKLNAFIATTPVYPLSPGLWTDPGDESRHYNDPSYWVNMARLLERGLFDGVFVSDVIGASDVYGGSSEASLRYGIQLPRLDPLLVVPFMAAATEHLGFGVTMNLSQEPPFLLARRLSTLDHLTGGRVGWNVVTGFLNTGAQAAGASTITEHDERYLIAEEYMSAVYRLWEDSWEDGAVLKDTARGVFADPSKIHKVDHDGRYFRLSAVHMTEPSPQRTPVLFQAGASPSGRDFAGRHAECIFLITHSKTGLARTIADLRQRTEKTGRDPADILMFPLVCIVVDETEEKAKAKLRRYREGSRPEGSLIAMSGYTGIDLSKYGMDDPFPNIKNSAAVQSVVDQFSLDEPGRTWTVRDVAELTAIGGRGPVFVGNPEQVADMMQEWMQDADADGFNLAHAVFPESYNDFIDLVLPVLQKRGVYKTRYEPGTFREKLFGRDRSRLRAPHPAVSRS